MRKPKSEESPLMRQVRKEVDERRVNLFAEQDEDCCFPWERLVKAREEAKLSQGKLAEICHMSPVTINLWEKGG